MLHIYFPDDELPDLPFKEDTGILFAKTKLACNKETQFLFKWIEEGTLCDDCTAYIDRFGFRLHLEDCSMGLKIALCVLYHPDMLINGIEAGINVIDVIAAVCHDGHVIIPDQTIDIVNYDNRPVDCIFHGYTFKGVPGYDEL